MPIRHSYNRQHGGRGLETTSGNPDEWGMGGIQKQG
jgi:hypothetical protein